MQSTNAANHERKQKRNQRKENRKKIFYKAIAAQDRDETMQESKQEVISASEEDHPALDLRRLYSRPTGQDQQSTFRRQP